MQRSLAVAALVMTAMCVMPSFAVAQAQPQIVASGLQFSEGTIFVGDTLFFVDFATSDVKKLVDGKVVDVWHRDGCGANGLVQVGQGLVIACYEGGSIETIGLDGRQVASIDRDTAGRPFESPNDLTSDHMGGLYLTASGSSGRSGKVYHRQKSGGFVEVAAGIAFANGLGVSPDGRILYVAETNADRLLKYAIAPDGTLGPRQEFVDLAALLGKARGKPGRATPDGLRVDTQGRLFVCLYNGGGVAVIDSTGRLVTQIDVPGAHHTSLSLSPNERFLIGTAVDDTASGYRGRLYKVANPVAP